MKKGILEIFEIFWSDFFKKKKRNHLKMFFLKTFFSKFSKYYQTLEDMFLKSSTNRMILIFIDAGEDNIY